MNRFRAKALCPLTVAAGTILMLFAFPGCPPDDGIDEQPGQVWVIGDITGTLAEELAVIFANRVEYDGVSANAPIFIAADSVATISVVEAEGVKDTFDDYFPVALIHGNAGAINELLGILGLDQNYSLPEGIA